VELALANRPPSFGAFLLSTHNDTIVVDHEDGGSPTPRWPPMPKGAMATRRAVGVRVVDTEQGSITALLGSSSDEDQDQDPAA
jgi:hypothetical protein